MSDDIFKFSNESLLDILNFKCLINKKNSIRSIDDNTFELILENFAKYISDNIDYKNKYSSSVLYKDYFNLKKYKSSNNFINSTVTIGNKIMEHFFPNIYDVKINKTSFSECWKDIELLKKVIRWNRNSHSTPYVSELKRGIYFCKGLTKTTMYRPTLMKLICDKYNVKNVIDPCAGWGGRLLGCCVNENRTYVGFEPNTQTFNNLNNLINFFNINNAIIYNDGCENVYKYIKNKSFDMVLTSPPYFDLEIYSDENTQSYFKYNSYQEWLNKWLKNIIKKFTLLLDKDGISCWNVADFKNNSFKQDVIKIHRDLNYKHIDSFYISSSKRPTNKNTIKNLDETLIFKNNE
jgi:16S rRNA G966 N2-methylase RsmD